MRKSNDQGIFDQNNVKVDLKWFDGYLESISTLNAQQIDANSQTLGDTVNSIAGGADQVVVLVNDNSTGNDKIIVSEGINSVQDLKGKKVAAEEGTVDHFLLLLGMKEAGLKPEDIEFVPLETGSAAAAFVAGQVDAVAVFAPFTTQALTRPNSKELFSSSSIVLPLILWWLVTTIGNIDPFYPLPQEYRFIFRFTLSICPKIIL